MKTRLLLISAVCFLVVLLYFFGDKLPSPCNDLLLPGFIPVLWINGSLHDHIMRGYALLGILFNCIFYSVLAFLGSGIVARLRGVR